MKAIAASPMTLCAALDELAAATWLEMEQGRRTRHPLDEEAITSYHLMRLAAAVPSIRLEKHTKHRESKSGADWEIWVGRSGALLGLRVQAKILRCETVLPEYKALYSSKAKATIQLDKLIASAESASPRTYPVVVFYNSIPGQSARDFHAIDCPRIAALPLLCGWTVASAYTLRARLLSDPSKHLCDLVDLMLPLSCMFCCPRSCPSSFAKDSLAERVAAQVRRAWPADDIDPVTLIGPGPIYVERLYKGEAVDTGWDVFPRWARGLFTGGREIPRGISRVLVVRDDNPMLP